MDKLYRFFYGALLVESNSLLDRLLAIPDFDIYYVHRGASVLAIVQGFRNARIEALLVARNVRDPVRCAQARIADAVRQGNPPPPADVRIVEEAGAGAALAAPPLGVGANPGVPRVLDPGAANRAAERAAARAAARAEARIAERAAAAAARAVLREDFAAVRAALRADIKANPCNHLLDLIKLKNLKPFDDCVRKPDFDINQVFDYNPIPWQGPGFGAERDFPEMNVRRGTLLWYALCSAKPDIIKILLRNPRIEVSAKLILYYHRDYPDRLSVFQKDALKIISKHPRISFDGINANHLNWLFSYAVVMNFIEFVEKIIDTNPEVEMFGLRMYQFEYYTPFELATLLNHNEMITLLTRNGANNMERILAVHAAHEARNPVVRGRRDPAEVRIIEFLKPVEGVFREGDPVVEATAFAKARTDPTLWRGFSKEDELWLNKIFSDVKPVAELRVTEAMNTTCCPICLARIDRYEGCMYMYHSCQGNGTVLDVDLYNKYKFPNGYVYWCANCQRPAKNHAHYQISHVFGPTPKVFEQALDVRAFQHDCGALGGGGHIEKIARFHALREEAKKLQAEIGTMTHKEAQLRLLIAFWNAPLNPYAVEIAPFVAAKKWPDDNPFPNNLPRPAENIARVYPPIPYPDAGNASLLPMVHARGRNFSAMEEVEPAIQFRHRKENGAINNHEDEFIGLETLFDALDSMIAGHGDAESPFGRCVTGVVSCTARTYPQEIAHILDTAVGVPAETMRDYREALTTYTELFNKKFAAPAGGMRTPKSATKSAKKSSKKSIKKSSRKSKSPFRSVKNVPSMFPIMEDASCAIDLPSKKKYTLKTKAKTNAKTKRV